MMRKNIEKVWAAVLCAAVLLGGTAVYVNADELTGDIGEALVMTGEDTVTGNGEQGAEERGDGKQGDREHELEGNSEAACAEEYQLPGGVSGQSAEPDFGEENEDGLKSDEENEDGLQIGSSSADAAVSGACGESLTWRFDSGAGTLTISGTGAMYDYYGDRPWEDYVYQIRELVLEAGVTYIGEAAFFGCTNIQSIELPSTVTGLGPAAFGNCYALSEAILNEGLENLPDYVFQNTELTQITIPASVKTMSSLAFFRCSLEDISVNSANPSYCSQNGVLFSKDMKTLLIYPENRQADWYQIPSGVTTVAEYAFDGASVSEVVIADTVTALGDGAFADSEISTLEIPDSVTSIGEYLCEGCAYLEKARIGKGLTALSYRTFAECSSLTDVDLGENLTDLDRLAFAYCRSLSEITIPPKVTEIKNGTFGECTSLTTVHFPAGLKEIWYQAFLNCYSLANVELPEGVTTINRVAFYGTAITEIDIPVSVGYIGEQAFPSGAKVNTNMVQADTGEYTKSIEVTIESEDLYSQAFRVLKYVNEEREKAGREAVKMDKALMELAFMRARELHFLYDHERPSGLKLGIPEGGWTFGENIAAGQKTAENVMNSWMNSTGHRSNILSSQFTRIGIGAVIIDGQYYWVQCFSDGDIEEVSASSYKDQKVQADVLISVAGDKASPEMNIGTTYLTPGKKTTVLFKVCGMEMPAGKLSCTSSDQSVCTIANGTITALKSGKSTITVGLRQYPDISLSKTVIVSDYIRGDADLSGEVDISDLRLVLRHVCGKISLTEDQKNAADVETDGVVNINDLRKILRYVCGKIKEL